MGAYCESFGHIESGLGKKGSEAIVQFNGFGFQRGDRVSVPGLGRAMTRRNTEVTMCKIPGDIQV